jgi:hypothetical protein
MKTFEVGKTYYMTSACDHNCTWTYEIVSRTAKTVILKSDSTEPSRFRISVWDDTEIVKPLGTYSMSPILSAARELKQEQPKKVISLQAKREKKEHDAELEKAKAHFLNNIIPNISHESLLRLANTDKENFKAEFTRILLEASINQAEDDLQ